MSLPRSLMLLNLSLRVFAGDVLEAGEFLSSTMFLSVNPIKMGCNGWSLSSRVRSVNLKGLFDHHFQKLVVGCGYLVFAGGSVLGTSFSHHRPRGWKDLGGGFPGHGAGPVRWLIRHSLLPVCMQNQSHTELDLMGTILHAELLCSVLPVWLCRENNPPGRAPGLHTSQSHSGSTELPFSACTVHIPSY